MQVMLLTRLFTNSIRVGITANKLLRRMCTNLTTELTNTMENTQSKKLSDMTPEELRAEVVRLQITNDNLVNTIKKQSEGSTTKWSKRWFDFKDTRKRHILLWVSYLGWSFNGFCTQHNSANTIEDVVKESLIKVNLVEDLSNYSRCGRTDKGVSAFSQVLSLDIRSIQPYDHSPLTTPELPYCSILNKVFPPDIRAIAWRPAKEDYDARFECIKRSYRYFFPKGNLNIEAMQKACTFLEGTHDFRNLCKMDVANGVISFVRTVDSAKIEQLEFQQEAQNAAFNMYFLTVESSGFLYHQIRCIMHVLYLVGEGNESPEVVNELLDVEKNPRKPQYTPAHELPLNLFSVEYPADGFDWIFPEDNMKKLEKHYLDQWTLQACKTAMLRSIVNEVRRLNPVKTESSESCILKCGSKGKHHPLMSRQKGGTLEERIDHFVKKKKIKIVQDEDNEARAYKVPRLKIEFEEGAETKDQNQAAVVELCSTLDKIKETKDVEGNNTEEPKDDSSGAPQAVAP